MPDRVSNDELMGPGWRSGFWDRDKEPARVFLCPVCNWTRPECLDSGVCRECWPWFTAEVSRGLGIIAAALGVEQEPGSP